jgi:kynurenine formamidase
VYHDALAGAKYVDLTHTITPSIPVWPGFGHATFGPSVDPKAGVPYRWAKDGFEATRYVLATDQLGTQLDPSAHWSPDYPAIDELPPTFAVRPLVVISIVDQVAKAAGYHLSVEDIQRWEAGHGRIPEGSVVFVRSDWAKAWPDSALATRRPFPGVSLAALRFLHEQRHILFHGHEPLDTDTTATLEGEDWLLNHGYTQAEGVANLDRGPRGRSAGGDGLPEVSGRSGRLRAVHRHLSAGLEVRRVCGPGAGESAAAGAEAAALGLDGGHAGEVTEPERESGSVSNPAVLVRRVGRGSLTALSRARAHALPASHQRRPVFTWTGDRSMKYLMLVKHSESHRGEPIPQALMDAMGEFVTESFKSGVLKDTAGLKPSAEGFRVRLSNKQLKVTDGPFTESKEVVGGYAIVEVPSREEALKIARQFMELHRQHWPTFEGESEVRPLEDM